MPTDRKLAAIAGALYLLTFLTSIPALALKDPFLRGRGTAIAAQGAALLEIVLALACLGTAIAIHPVGRRFDPALALGFVGSRILEAAIILFGVVALLAVTSVPTSTSAGAVLVALHDWAFLVGPGFLPAVNALLLGSLLYRHRLVPRAIPLAGLIGAPLLTASSLGTILGVVDQVSPLAAIAALPIALWEFSIGVWLIAKGFSPGGAATQRAIVQPGIS